MQALDQVDRALRIFARLHIDPDKTADRIGIPHQLLDIRAALVVGEIQAELGQLRGWRIEYVGDACGGNERRKDRREKLEREPGDDEKANDEGDALVSVRIVDLGVAKS